MTDAEILQECRMATMEERVLSRQIDRLAMIGGPQGIGTQALKPAGDRKTNNTTAGQMQQLEGLIERLLKKQNEDIWIIQQAEEIIERIKSRKDRYVIRCYYVEGESEYTIAENIDMSRQWVNQRRNQIIDELTMPKKKSKHSQSLLK
jgi:hypothetical protein